MGERGSRSAQLILADTPPMGATRADPSSTSHDTTSEDCGPTIVPREGRIARRIPRQASRRGRERSAPPHTTPITLASCNTRRVPPEWAQIAETCAKLPRSPLTDTMLIHTISFAPPVRHRRIKMQRHTESLTATNGNPCGATSDTSSPIPNPLIAPTAGVAGWDRNPESYGPTLSQNGILVMPPPGCSVAAPRPLPGCSLPAPSLLLGCSLAAPWLPPGCSRAAPRLLLAIPQPHPHRLLQT